MNKTFLLLSSLFLCLQIANSQCPGAWDTRLSGFDYLCADGPFLQYDYNSACPATAQDNYVFTEPQSSVQLYYSAFGSQGFAGQSRMAIFLNGVKADLHNACKITVGCQSDSGTYSVSGDGCLVDSISGSDGGISGYIVVSASEYGLSSIDSIGVAVYEPGASGTVFQIGSCVDLCISTGFYPIAASLPLSIYPNPVNDLLNIKAVGEQVQNIRIYGLSGNLVYSTSFKTTMDVSALSRGAYFIEFVSPDYVVRKKFVKM